MLKKLIILMLVIVIGASLLASCTIVVPQGGNGGNTDDGNGGTTDGGNGQTPPDDGGTTDGGNGQTPPDGGTTGGDNGQTPPDGGNVGTPPDEGVEPDNLIYNSSSELALVFGSGIDDGDILNVQSYLYSYKWENLSVISEDNEALKHEIVFGNTSRPISKAANDRLARNQKNTDDEYSFLIYSDGLSVAVVWEDDFEGVIKEKAIEYFCDTYLDEELIAPRGELHNETVDLLEFYTEKDTIYRAPLWEELRNTYGNALAEAYQRYYSIYDPDGFIIWISNLYDSDICICQDLYGAEECSGTKYCGTGGFYYSNSGRDTQGFLPDAESTAQTLSFLQTSGLAYQRGNAYVNVITEEMKQQIGDFIYSLEEPNGYFYHPQWGIAFTDKQISRRGRDLSWCCQILSALGRTPKYTTASGVKGEDAVKAAASMTGRLGLDRVSAVSKVITAAETYAEHLQDLDSFKKYLDGLNIRTSSYNVGNELNAQYIQIQARDKEIGTEDDPTPLRDYLIKWLDDNQNTENGTWDFEPADGYRAYYATNGIMKISTVYSALGAMMPNADKAAVFAINAITNSTEIKNIVDIYNPWVSVSTIIGNVGDFGDSADADALLEQIRAIAPSAIDSTRLKVSEFLKEDGSGSYTKLYSSASSQGCPVALPNSVEGDVNGACIAVNGTYRNTFQALGLTQIYLFGERQWYLFRKEIADLSDVIKDAEIGTPDPIDFELDEIGAQSEYVNITHNNGSTGSALVIADPTNSGKGKVTEMISHKGGGDVVAVPVGDNSINTTYVFEGDFNIASCQTAYAMQLSLNSCYRFSFRMNGDKIEVWETSSINSAFAMERYLGISVDMNKWFRLRVEYYCGDHDTVRIKFYADTDLSDGTEMKLYAVTDNYYDANGVKLTGVGKPSSSLEYVNIFALENTEIKLYLDNLNCYREKLGYIPVTDPENQPYINIDSPEKDRVTYNFDDGKISEDITVQTGDGSFKVDESNRLSVSGSASASSLKIPVTVRESGANCDYMNFKLNCSEASSDGKIMTITGKAYTVDVFSFDVMVMSGAEGKYITLQPNGAEAGKIIENIKIPIENETVYELSLAYYREQEVVAIYLNGEFAAATSNLFAAAKRAVLDNVVIGTAAGKSFSLTLDDIVVEKMISDFEKVMAPSVEEKLYDFSSADADVKTTGNGTRVEGGKLVMNTSSSAPKNSVKLPINNRSNVVNSALVMLELKYSKAAAQGTTHILKLTDAEGNTSVAFELAANGDKVELYEVGKGGRLNNPVYSYNAADTVVLKLEVYSAEKIVYIYDGDAVKVKSSIFAGAEYLETEFAYLVLESGEAMTNITLDNVRCETLYSAYKNLEVEGVKNSEKEGMLDFESSSTGNLPDSFDYTFTGTSSLTIENVITKEENVYSNILAYSKPSSGNDKLFFTNSTLAPDASCITFEADIKFELSSKGYMYRLYFYDEARKNSGYFLNMTNYDGKLNLIDVSSAGSESGIVSYDFSENMPSVKDGEWFNLRIEYYKGSIATTRIKLFVNDVCVGISDNYAGNHTDSQPMNQIQTVMLFSMDSTKGYLYFDNVSLTSSNASCTEDVTVGNGK